MRRLDPDDFLGEARRLVLAVVIWLLWVVGALVGAGAGTVFYHASSKSGGAVIASVLVGVGSALGSWFVASIVGLVVEMANSLRLLARLAEINLEVGQRE